MKIVNVKDVKPHEFGEGSALFYGGKVTTQSLLREECGPKIGIVMVKFEPGVRNKFHAHTTGQILYVTDGKGIVATRDKEYVVTPGTAVYIPPGEMHWHGATDDSSFAHLSILGTPSDLTISED